MPLMRSCYILIFSLKLTVLIYKQNLNSLLNWSHTWQMSLNPKKCELRIANKKYPVTCNYFIDSSPIKEVSHSKYLGVIIDNKLSWNPHIQHNTTRATQVNVFIPEPAEMSFSYLSRAHVTKYGSTHY